MSSEPIEDTVERIRYDIGILYNRIDERGRQLADMRKRMSHIEISLIARQPQESRVPWTEVHTDGLPDPGVVVLATDANGAFFICERTMIQQSQTISHWMPLPKPPEKS